MSGVASDDGEAAFAEPRRARRPVSPSHDGASKNGRRRVPVGPSRVCSRLGGREAVDWRPLSRVASRHMSADLFALVGTVVDGRYRIDSVVGEGAFGVVYRGWHLAFGHPIAVKCLKVPAHFTTVAKEAFLAQFRGEGEFLSKLSAHPAVVRVFDLNVIEREGGQLVPYLVLEWLDGVELEALLQERRLAGAQGMSEVEAVGLLRPVLEAVALAHDLKIVHRDLKPRNLYLARTPWGTALKVLDFGIAKAMQEGETATRLATGTSSTFNAFTPDYGAPEQFVASKYGVTGPWTDVHAFGLILTELVAGRRVYGGTALFELYEEATQAQRPTPRSKGAEVSDAFEQLCAKALSVNPVDRFRDARELLVALDQMVSPQAALGQFAQERSSVGELAVGKIGRDESSSGPVVAAELAPIQQASGNVASVQVELDTTMPAATQRADFLVGIQGALPDARGFGNELGQPVDDLTGTVVAGFTPPDMAGGGGYGRASTPGAGGYGPPAMPGAGGYGPPAMPAVIPPPPERSETKSRARFLWPFAVVMALGGAVAWMMADAGDGPEPGESPSASASGAPSAAPSLSAPRPEAGAMVSIPSGTFMMGASDGNPDERPVHSVTVPAFEMDLTEVTVRAYQACVAAGRCIPRHAVASDWYVQHGGLDQWSRACNYERPGRALHPMNCVDWSDADSFCRWAGKRLPTEEEWEYAARGPASRKFPWGNDAPTSGRLNACGSECVSWVKQNTGLRFRGMFKVSDSWPTTAPVGSFPSGDSPFGLHDMAGNVWEWTATKHCAYDRPGCSAVSRVNRGGCWGDWDPADVSSARRSGSPPSIRDGNLGFRCAK